MKSKRLHGLDFARFFAFAGMVYVNFHIVTGAGTGAPWAEIFLLSLEGKAAATFVVLAGIGFGLGYKARPDSFNKIMLKRILFLLVIGLINMLIFPADIIHYYAIYFIFALFLIRYSTRIIAIVALLLPLIFIALLFLIDYETAWNWKTLDYADFWTFNGFIRNLFYNGFHPVIPWLSFLLLGIILARFDLHCKALQKKLVIAGFAMLVIAYSLSISLSLFGADVAELVSVLPMPPLPLYMLAGSGAAILVIGVSLLLFDGEKKWFLSPFTIAGKQALTLYIAHIIIGMGVLEELGLLEGQSAEFSIYFSSTFIFASIIYALIWSRFFNNGPIEWLLRKLTA